MSTPPPTADRIYETETMAELCARQGRLTEAIAIYRRLAAESSDASLRARCRGRLAMLEATWRPLRDVEVPAADIALPEAPGVAVQVGDDQITVAWALASDTTSAALDLLIIQRAASGVETQKKTIPLDALAGRLGLAAPGVHSALAAVGSIVEGRFVPLARSAGR